MYLSEIPRYRDVVMERICKCDAIIDLIRPEDQPNMKASDMAYKYIFPYDYIVDKTTEVGSYLCFDVAAPRIIDHAFLISVFTSGLFLTKEQCAHRKGL